METVSRFFYGESLSVHIYNNVIAFLVIFIRDFIVTIVQQASS